MNHTLEPAASGRAKCRACGELIKKGELRLGERLPNPFADGEMVVWFHPQCGAFKRPEALAVAIAAHDGDLAEGDALLADAALTRRWPRLERLGPVEPAPSGRARCRHCRETIGKDAWRMALRFFEEGMYSGGGYLHATCVADYVAAAPADLTGEDTDSAPVEPTLSNTDITERLQHFSDADARESINQIVLR